jgi:hypothetical protein
VAGDHWVIQGDRGVTYMTRCPPEEEIVDGAWWPDDYDGPPLVAFAAEEAGDRPVRRRRDHRQHPRARHHRHHRRAREVEFENAGIGFILTMSQNALAGAPHTHIATVYAEEEAEAAILRDVAGDAPNITAIRVRDAIDQVAEALRSLAAATSYGAAATLDHRLHRADRRGGSGRAGRVFEAAVLKTLGAARGSILASFALRSALLGMAAGLVAIAAGALGGWSVTTFVMDTTYRFEPVSALAIVIGGRARHAAGGPRIRDPPAFRSSRARSSGTGLTERSQPAEAECLVPPLCPCQDAPDVAGQSHVAFRPLTPGSQGPVQGVRRYGGGARRARLPKTGAPTYVVGDIHGRADLLELLLGLIDAHIGGTDTTARSLSSWATTSTTDRKAPRRWPGCGS